jgi:hypothetical protein
MQIVTSNNRELICQALVLSPTKDYILQFDRFDLQIRFLDDFHPWPPQNQPERNLP